MIKRISLFIIAFSIILSTNRCSQPDQKNTSQASTISEDFTIASPESVGLDTAKLEFLKQAILSGEYPNIHSVLISKDGKLVYEQYFKGKDEIWGDDLGVIEHNKDDLHDIRSVSKSVVSACIGVAIAQGKIDSINQRVFDFYPEYAQYDSGIRSNLTVEHLLTMSSGIEWNEDVPYDDPRNSEILMTSSPDPIAFVLSRPMETEPGQVWEYNGGTTQLLASIIKKVSGKEIDEFAKEHLFAPLGIQEFTWTRFPGLDLPAAASGLRLRSRDLMKFGMLYANRGKWDGVQILPEAWVDASFQSHVSLGRRKGAGYGYQFWISESNVAGQEINLATAIGNGGQRIFVDRTRDLIVVITAGNYNQWDIKNDSHSVLYDLVYPAFGF
ncbi:MAG: serine hydrolase [Bacteroidota bacterium]